MSQADADLYAREQNIDQLNILYDQGIYPSRNCMVELHEKKSHWKGLLGDWYREKIFSRNAKFYDYYH